MTTIERLSQELEPVGWHCAVTQQTIRTKGGPGRKPMVFFRDAFTCVDLLCCHRLMPFTLLAQACSRASIAEHVEKCCLADDKYALTAAVKMQVGPARRPRRLVCFELYEAGRGEARGWFMKAIEIQDGKPMLQPRAPGEGLHDRSAEGGTARDVLTWMGLVPDLGLPR